MLVLGGSVVTVGARARSGVAGRARRFLEEREFNSLFARTARPLASYLRRLTSDEEAANDLLQESYLRLLRNEIPVMSDGELDAYLYKTASRLARDRWRHAAVDRRWRERLPEGHEEPAERPGSTLDLKRILGRLRPRDRALVWLAYVEGRTHAEIAEILSLRAASVRVLLFRARKKLAGILAAEGLAPEVGQ